MSNTQSNLELICPYCGYKEQDPEEIFSEIEQTIGSFECAFCGEDFIATKTALFTYNGKEI